MTSGAAILIGAVFPRITQGYSANLSAQPGNRSLVACNPQTETIQVRIQLANFARDVVARGGRSGVLSGIAQLVADDILHPTLDFSHGRIKLACETVGGDEIGGGEIGRRARERRLRGGQSLFEVLDPQRQVVRQTGTARFRDALACGGTPLAIQASIQGVDTLVQQGDGREIDAVCRIAPLSQPSCAHPANQSPDQADGQAKEDRDVSSGDSPGTSVGVVSGHVHVSRLS